ncbi:hypothetical protein HELRODRAFT_161303 [Helobdella robusta]|uniref:Uncharacterized protein n=1 Tax=Helobdella robusta TaxID=6412 RepID=T1ERB5_HELRO|nr:hypothetical protein HELRODRAFT_161303 [Helobdella robusta]ESO02076.1 hypothetical protein HELRODRAFT_161303 [Helobdella robusta]
MSHKYISCDMCSAPSWHTADMSADRKKKKIIADYHKYLKNEKKNLSEWSSSLKKIYESEGQTALNPKKKKMKKKVSMYHNEMKEFKKRNEEKLKKKQAFLEKKKEMEDATRRYQADQKRKRKLLYKKNYKGQPKMEARMQLLLEKIEKSSKYTP